MSLINQMLRDLEKRRNQEDRQFALGRDFAVAGMASPSSRLKYLLAGGVLLIALTWFGLDYFLPANKSPMPTVKMIASSLEQIATHPKGQKPTAQLPPETAVEKPFQNQGLRERGKSSTSRLTAMPPAQNKLVSTVAGPTASRLLNLGILETSGSARLMFEFARMPGYELKPNVAGAKQLLVNFKRADLQPGLVVPPVQGPLLQTVSLQAEQHDLQLSIELAQPGRYKSLELPADQFHGARLLVDIYKGQAEATPVAQLQSNIRSPASGASPANEMASVNQVVKSSSAPSREEQAAMAYWAGVEQFEASNFTAAESNLMQALILRPEYLDARLKLIELLFLGQRHAEAEDHLILGLKLHPGDFELRKNYARLLLSGKQAEEAIELLQEDPLPEIAADLEYHALLAALWQETGDHGAAADHYAKLLKVRPQNSLWWLGMGIALDQQEEYTTAKNAYTKALELQSLRPDLEEYARVRLQEL